MSIKAKIEAIIYAAEEPVTFNQIFALVKEEARQELLRERQAERDQQETTELRPGLIPTSAEAVPSGDRAAEPVESPDTIGLAAPVDEIAGDSGAVPPDLAEAQDQRAGAVTPEGSQTSADTPPEQPDSIAEGELRSAIRAVIEELMADYAAPAHGIEVRQIAGGYRMATKPEQHDVVRTFAKSLKPPIRLSLQALETLAVIAYKQPVTAPEISEIRGVDSGGVLGTLLDRKLITTAGRKQVVGRPILYKTTKEFLMRFGLKDVTELPSMEEFEKLAAESLGADLLPLSSSEPTPEQTPAAAEEAPVAEAPTHDNEEAPVAEGPTDDNKELKN